MSTSPVRSNPVLAAAALVVLGVLAPAPGRTQVDPAMQDQVRGARTVRLEVRQTYDFSESEGPGEPTGGKDFLPLMQLASEIVELAGWRVATAGSGDLTLRIDVTGDALGAEYTGTLSGFHYSGASLSGTVTLLRQGEVVSEQALDESISPPHMITSSHSSPRSAPFATLLPEYCAAVWTAVGRGLGPARLVAALPRATGDVREGMLEALIVVSDQTTAPSFRAMLKEQDPVMIRLGALGLGVVGEGSEVPALLDALRALKDDPPAEASAFQNWLEDSTEFEYEDVRGLARGLARREWQGPRHALIWALRQRESPEVRSALIAAAQGRDQPLFRASAVLLLGQLEDPAAAAQVAAALSDGERLVRIAALTAVADRTDDRVAEPILRLAEDDAADVRELARERLIYLADEKWSAWLAEQRTGGEQSLAREFMEKSFAHADPRIRLAALHRAAEPEGRPHRDLISRMASQDRWAALRAQAIEVVKDDQSSEGYAALAAALRDPVPFVRAAAAAALAGESTEWEQSAPPALPESIVEPALALARQDPATQGERAVTILGRVGGASATQALQQLAREGGDEAVRQRAVTTLVKTRPSSAAPILLALAENATGSAVDMNVGLALGELAHPATLEPLIALLKSGSPARRRVAGLALGRMKLMRAAGPLIAALQAAESASLVRDEEFIGILRTSLQELTGRWFYDAEEARRWWRENSAQLTAR